MPRPRLSIGSRKRGHLKYLSADELIIALFEYPHKRHGSKRN